MPAPLVPVAVVVLSAVAFRAVGKRQVQREAMNKEREDCFRGAMKALQDPAKLRALADTFEREGHPTEAQLLRNRAKLREWPPEVKKARRAAFRKAMRSLDADGVEGVATGFARLGAHGAAEELRAYARALRLVDPARIEDAAMAYEGKAYRETAEALRRRASEVAEAARAEPPADETPPDEAKEAVAPTEAVAAGEGA